MEETRPLFILDEVLALLFIFGLPAIGGDAAQNRSVSAESDCGAWALQQVLPL